MQLQPSPNSFSSNTKTPDSERKVPNAKHFNRIRDYCDNHLSPVVEKSVGTNRIPVILGGDHSIEMGTLKGLTNANGGTPPGVIYFDAHADINSPGSSPSGNVHGMDLYFAWRDKTLNPDTLVYIGLRNPDPAETQLLEKLNVPIYTPEKIRTRGIDAVVEEIRKRVGEKAHVSFDVDVIDKEWVPGTGTPEPNGLKPEEAHALLKKLSPSIGSMTIAEVDPLRDHNGQTVRLASEFLDSALSKKHEAEVHMILSPMALGQPHLGPAFAPKALYKKALPELQAQGFVVESHLVPLPELGAQTRQTQQPRQAQQPVGR